MAIIKLGDIIYETVVGKDAPNNFSITQTYKKNYPVVSNASNESKIMGYTDKWLVQKDSITISARGTIGYVSFWSEPIYPVVRLLALVPNINKVFPKFLFYKLKTIKFQGTGAVQKQLTKPMIKDVVLEIPSLEEQRKIIDIIEQHEELFLKYTNCVRIDDLEIANKDMNLLIDIIEPIEIFLDKLLGIKNNILNILKFITNNYSRVTNELLINKVNFLKGKPKKGAFLSKGTPFIDIRMLNSEKITNYVDEVKNVTFGDVLLSLDGTTGIVKYNVEGFNGYAFLVESSELSKLEIYLNLVSFLNQEIIKSNSIGTTIKHASNAKGKMIYIEMPKELKNKSNSIYNLLVNIEKQIFILKKLKEQIINLLIK